MTRPCNNQKKKKKKKKKRKKKRTWRIVNYSVPVDLWVKLKESEKRGKYPDFARDLKKTEEHEKWLLYQF